MTMKPAEYKTEDQLRSRANGFFAQQREDEALLGGLLNRDVDLGAELRRAFATLEQDGYGRCEDCEALITPARLRAIPWARCCVRCQEARDREVNEADIFPEAA